MNLKFEILQKKIFYDIDLNFTNDFPYQTSIRRHNLICIRYDCDLENNRNFFYSSKFLWMISTSLNKLATDVIVEHTSQQILELYYYDCHKRVKLLR